MWCLKCVLNGDDFQSSISCCKTLVTLKTVHGACARRDEVEITWESRKNPTHGEGDGPFLSPWEYRPYHEIPYLEQNKIAALKLLENVTNYRLKTEKNVTGWFPTGSLALVQTSNGLSSSDFSQSTVLRRS